MAGVLQSGGQGVGQSCPSVISAEAKADGGRWPARAECCFPCLVLIEKVSERIQDQFA